MISPRDACSTQLDTWRQLEPIIERFESDWLAGRGPSIDAYLDVQQSLRLTLLAELIHADLELRAERDEIVPVEDYVNRYPELCDHPTIVMELLVAEAEIRGRPKLPDEATGLPSVNDDSATAIGYSATGLYQDDAGIHGARFGDLEILEEIARGGMGIIYKARQISLNRIVALKMMRAGIFADQTDRARFQFEMQALARLQHPNIVAVHEIGEIHNQPYFSMDYIDGAVLSDLLAAGDTTPTSTVVAHLETIALAVDDLHQHGLVHRDLKPSNVLIDAGDRPVITDFGLAVLLEDDSQLTRSGQWVGTPCYMPPEQIDRTKEITPASDVYSLGAILYEVLVGQPPFHGDSGWTVMQRVLSEPPAPPSSSGVRSPKDLETIALKCLEKDPARRYQSARALAEELGRYREGQPILARPISRPQRAWRCATRHPKTTAAWLASALVLVVAVATAGIAFFEARVSSMQRDSLSQEADQLRIRQSAALKNVKTQAQQTLLGEYQLGLAEVLSDWERRPDHALRVLESDACMEQLRDGRWHFLRSLLRRDHMRMAAHRGRITEVDFFPDGSSLASAGYDGRLLLWNALSGELLAEFPKQENEIVAMDVSPTGDRIATACAPKTGALAFHRPEIRLWDPKSGRQLGKIISWEGIPCTVSALEFSPDGNLLAVGTEDFYGTRLPAIVSVFEVATGKLRFARPLHLNRVVDVAFSPNGKCLASASWDGTVKVWDSQSGELLHDYRKHDGARLLSVAWSRDGAMIASGGRDNLIRVWDPRDGSELMALRGHANPINQIDFSPDSQTIVSVSEEGTIKLWDALTGHLRTTVVQYRGSPRRLKFAPDGRGFASGSHSGTVRYWKLDPGKALWTARGHSDSVNDIIFVNDEIVSGGNDGRIIRWDSRVQSGQSHSSSSVPILALKAAQQRGTFAAIRHWQAVATVFEGDSLDPLQRFSRHDGPVNHLALSADGNELVTMTSRGALRVWDASNGNVLWQFETSKKGYLLFSVSCQGRRIVAVNDSEINTWTVDAGFRNATHQSYRLAESAIAACQVDDRTIAIATDTGKIQLVDATDGLAKAQLDTGGENVTCLTASCDGRILACGLSDWSIGLWDLAKRSRITELRGHTDQVTCLAFREDGRVLASGSRDRTVKTWSVPLDADPRWTAAR